MLFTAIDRGGLTLSPTLDRSPEWLNAIRDHRVQSLTANTFTSGSSTRNVIGSTGPDGLLGDRGESDPTGELVLNSFPPLTRTLACRSSAGHR